MSKYKLLRQDMTTYKDFAWKVGEKYTIDKPGSKLCSDQVFHFYESPEEAIIFNPIHANIKNPLIYSCKCENIVATDGTKGGCKSMTLLKKIELPAITIEQKITFAIYCAKTVYKGKRWNKWADNWLSGKDRRAPQAAAAAHAVNAVYAIANCGPDVYTAAAAASAAAASAAASADADANADVGDLAAAAATDAAVAAAAAVADAAVAATDAVADAADAAADAAVAATDAVRKIILEALKKAGIIK